jgi:hypothetical protein
MITRQFLVILISLLFLASINSTFSQTIGGSPYSFFGIGGINNSGSVGINQMLGGTGIALRDSSSLNTQNPAAYNSILKNYTQVTTAGLGVSSYSLSEDDDTFKNTELMFNDIAFWFRIFKNSGLTLGISPYSKVNYNIVTTNSLSGLPGLYNVNYQGSGGLTKLYTGTSFELIKNFSVGANINFIFGIIGQDIDLIADDYGFSYQITKKTHLRAFMFDFGAQYLLNFGNHTITFGGVYNLKKKLTGDYNYEILASDELIYEFTETVNDYYIPESYGIGFSYKTPFRLMVTMDYLQKNWSEVDIETDYLIQDSERYGFGLMIPPKWSSMGYFGRIGWGIGGFYEKTYLKINRQDIDGYGLSFGIRLPAGRNTIIDITYDNSFNAMTTENLIQETRHNISVQLNLFDIWFKRPKIN